MENNGFDPTAMPTAGNSTSSASSFDIKKLMENKKAFYGIIGGVAALIVIIVVICVLNGGKKLVCTKEDEFGGIKEKSIITLKFKGDVPSAKVETIMDYSGSDSVSEEDLKTNIESTNKSYDELKKNGEAKFDYKATLNGKVVTMTMTYTADQFKEEAKETIDALEDKSIEGYKKHFEASKYTCK